MSYFSTSKKNWRNQYIPNEALIAGFLSFLMFSPSLFYEFVNWDDSMFVINNEEIRSLRPIALFHLWNNFIGGCYAPLSSLSWAFDYWIWNLNPFGYHLTNILLHSANVVLVCSISSVIFAYAGYPEKCFRLSLIFIGLFFGLHPLRVESVAWISERRDVLNGFFSLLTILTYLYSHQNSSAVKKEYRWLVIIFFAASLLAKGNSISLPIVLLLFDIYPLSRLEGHSFKAKIQSFIHLLKEKWVLFVMSMSAAALAVYAQWVAGAMTNVQVLPLDVRLADCIIASAHYLSKFILPLSLNPHYLFDEAYDWKQPIVLSTFFGFVSLAILFWSIRKRWPFIFWFSIASICLIAPFLGVFQIGRTMAADRYTYLSAIPLSIACGLLAQKLEQRLQQPRLVSILYFVIISCLALLTYSQLKIWKNSEALWKHSLTLNPKNPYAWRNLAGAFNLEGKHEQALWCGLKATEIISNDSELWNDLGGFYLMVGKYADARNSYQKAINISPTYVSAHHNKGLAELKLGDADAALVSFEMANKYDPCAITLLGIGSCYEAKGDLEKAISFYQIAAAEGESDGVVSWARALAASGKKREALELLLNSMPKFQKDSIRITYLDVLLTLTFLNETEIRQGDKMIEELRLKGCRDPKLISFKRKIAEYRGNR
jgi:protein O-mannosyl-transferase